ncbi:23S rRNA (adenine(2503)-C(2))-methyltransferase RlmN [Chloroflexota bacterium]
MKPSIYDKRKNEIDQLINDLEYESYRASQIWEGLYKNNWETPEDFIYLPTHLREALKKEFDFTTLFLEKSIESKDLFTEKVLFRLRDNLAVETVLMRYKKRNTVCISTQVGCAMDCKFCATGRMGFQRNLSIGEIIAQVMFFSKKLSLESKRLSNIVVMGMGEPFLNYENTLGAISILNDKTGFNFGSRRFTISTVGIVPMIHRFISEKHQINLAISLHAAENSLRTKLIPINEKFSIESIFEACDEYIETTHRRVSIEWALIHEVNDDTKQASLLASRIQGKNYHVNLIPLNSSTFFIGESSSTDRIFAFKKIIESNGINCSIRLRRGIDIQAGCGQLMNLPK